MICAWRVLETVECKKQQSFKNPPVEILGGFFIMYTTEQADTLRQYKALLNDYNTGKLDYQTFVELTLPIWDRLNILFERDQKTS